MNHDTIWLASLEIITIQNYTVRVTSYRNKQWNNAALWTLAAGYPLGEIISVCDLYEIMLIIIIISLGQIFLSYISNTSRTHTRTHAHTHTRTHTHTHAHHHRRSGCRCSMGRWRPTVTELTPLFTFRLAICSLLHAIKHSRGPLGFPRCRVFFAYTKIARPNWHANSWCDWMCFLSIWTVWDISRYDLARIAPCSLLTTTDRLRTDYNIDWNCNHSVAGRPLFIDILEHSMSVLILNNIFPHHSRPPWT